MAEGHAAIHAASALLALFFFGEGIVNLKPVHKAVLYLAAGGLFTLNL
jgi:hypothetical protein